MKNKSASITRSQLLGRFFFLNQIHTVVQIQVRRGRKFVWWACLKIFVKRHFYTSVSHPRLWAWPKKRCLLLHGGLVKCWRMKGKKKKTPFDLELAAENKNDLSMSLYLKNVLLRCWSLVHFRLTLSFLNTWRNSCMKGRKFASLPGMLNL